MISFCQVLIFLNLTDPDLKAVVASGYSNDPVMADHQAHGFKAAVAKPFEVDELGEVLHKALSGSESS